MPTTQRLHVVLAKDAQSANPIMDALIKNGLEAGKVAHAIDRYGLIGRDPEKIAFVIADNFWDHPDFTSFYKIVCDFILRGAVKKAVPRRVAMEEAAAEPKPVGFWERMQQRSDAYGQARIDQYKQIIKETCEEMAPGAPIFGVKDAGINIKVSEDLTIPTGSFWDIMRGPMYAAGKKAEEALSPNSKPAEKSAGNKPEYMQVFLGGGLMNNLRSPHVFSLVPGTVLSFTDDITTHSYMLYRYPISGGQWVYAWISEDMWGERATLVRDFLLKPLEV